MKWIKRFIYVIFLSLIIIPVVYAKDNIEIISIELDSKSEGAVIKSEPSFSGLEMNFDLKFKQTSDFAKYKIIIKNDTEIDYKLSEDTSFDESRYITYKYQLEDEIKAKSETLVYLTITYNKKIEDDLLVNSKYTETNKAVVNLSSDNEEVVEPGKEVNEEVIEEKIVLPIVDDKGEVVNPKTSAVNPYIVIISLSIAIIILVILLIKKKAKYTVIPILIGLSLIPVLASALEELRLTINVNVEIARTYRVDYILNGSYLFTDEEMKNLRMGITYSCLNVYIGSFETGKKYNYCTDMIYSDNTLYYSLEEVELKEMKLKYIYDVRLMCESEDGANFVCPSDLELLEEDISHWHYDYEILNIYGYTYLDDDREVMAFATYEGDVDFTESDSFEVKAPQKFKMPSHDILLSPIPYEYCYFNVC